MPLTLQATHADCVVATAGPLLVCVWTGRVSLSAVAVVDREQRAAAARHGRIASLHVVRGGRTHSIPEAGAEERLAEVAARTNPALSAAAMVIEGTGTGAAIAHGTGARTIPHVTAPFEIFASLREALAWLARLPGQPPEVATARALAPEIEALGR